MAALGVRLFEQTGHNYTYHVDSLTTLNDLKRVGNALGWTDGNETLTGWVFV